jgi:hypothetical protein
MSSSVTISQINNGQSSLCGDTTGRLTEIKQSIEQALTLEPLNQLQGFPNIVETCMSIFQAESGFECWPMGSSNSRHQTIVCGNDSYINGIVTDLPRCTWKYGKSFWTDYWHDSVIQNYIKTYGQSPAIIDGLYAHGVSATMGAYHIKYTKAWNVLFGLPLYQPLVTSFNLQVPAGVSITQTVYTANDQPNRKKSIVAGLIVLHSKVMARLNGVAKQIDINNLNTVMANDPAIPIVGQKFQSPQQILILAVGDYLGSFVDANNTSALSRMMQVYSQTSWAYRSTVSGSTVAYNGGAAQTPGCTG